MNDECTGPFTDAFDCPVHDPRKNAQTRPKGPWERRAEAMEAYAALLAALDALATEMDQEHADRYFAGKLKDILATHRKAR